MKSLVRLVIVTPGFTSGTGDTTSIPSLQLYVNKLHILFPEMSIRLISLHYPYKPSVYQWKGVQVYTPGRKPGLLKPLLWHRAFRYLKSLKNNEGIDVIHSFWLTDSSLLASVFGKFAGIPVICTAMGQDVLHSNHYVKFLRIIKPEIVSISSFQGETLRKNHKIESSAVIPFGTDEDLFGKNGTIKTLDILGAGSLNKTKNWSNFLEIIEKLKGRFPEIRCAIAGEGPERENLEQQILALGLSDTVLLLGKMEYKELISLMESSRILLHTSSFEGQGLVITEALAAGAYVVSYPVGIAATIKSSKLITGSNQHELFRNLANILSDQKINSSREVFWTIKATCLRYMELYNILCAYE